MALPIPNLDDLDFEALVEQARGFIPRYAPDWTDHNIHDPGITLIELAAWLVDQQIYRVGFVSDRHIKSFAALLGVTQKPAEPAQGLIWPNNEPSNNGQSRTGVNIAAGANAVCSEQPDISFQLAESVYVTHAQVIKGRETNTQPVNRTRRKTNNKPEPIELVFDQPLIIEDCLESYNPLAIGIELAGKERQPRLMQSHGGRLIVDYRVETVFPTWRRVAVSLDTTAALNQTGVVLVDIPAVEVPTGKTPPISRLRIRVEQRVNPLPLQIKRVELNVLPVIQTEVVPQAVIGNSNGLPDQSLQLNLQSLPQGKLPTIQVVEDDKFVEWKAVDNLSLEGPGIRGFELYEAKNEFRFGNGVNGRIPPKNAQIRNLAYKLTQGQAGNLQSGLSWSVAGTPLQSGQTTYGINRAPLFGGADAWDMQQLIAEARRAALVRDVLLSNSDLENAAKSLPGMAVERADVLVGFHPSHPKKNLKNTRSLVVVPARVDAGSPAQSVSLPYFSAIDRLLQPRRVLGERLSILSARNVPITIQANLLHEDGVQVDAVIEEAKLRLKARFSDIQTNNEWQIEPWPLGRDVKCREIQALLAKVTGVVAVTECMIAKNGNELQNSDIALQRDEIAIGGELIINVISVIQERN